MAERMNLKPFYYVLGAIAVVGLGAIMVIGTGGRSGPRELDAPIPMSAGAFDGYSLGRDAAPVTIVEYADFECPACAQFAILTAPDVKARLVQTGRVRWVFRDFPLPGHDKAPLAHHAAACAAEQGRFWEMHDQLYFNQGAWVRDRRPERLMERMAEALGLAMDQYRACMDADRYTARIRATREAGLQMGVNSTPTFIVGKQMVAGNMPLSEIERLVSAAEAGAGR